MNVESHFMWLICHNMTHVQKMKNWSEISLSIDAFGMQYIWPITSTLVPIEYMENAQRRCMHLFSSSCARSVN